MLFVVILSLWLAHGEEHNRNSHHFKNNLSRHCRQIASELAIPPEQKDEIEVPGSWYFNFWEPNWSCALEERVMWMPDTSKVTAGDGGKWVCDVPALMHKPNCLIYSVGSSGDFRFEVGLLELMDGRCEIHVFDIDSFGNKGYPEKYFNQIHRHVWGLSSVDEVVQGKTLKTMASTMKELGHTGRTIHMLKMDIEGWEIGMLDNPLFWSELDKTGSDIEQLLLETHMAHFVRLTYAEKHEKGRVMDNLLRNLTAQGFAMFHKEINMLWTYGCEFAFVRTRPNCKEFTQMNKDSSYAGLSLRGGGGGVGGGAVGNSLAAQSGGV